jgi:hypothetical protein
MQPRAKLRHQRKVQVGEVKVVEVQVLHAA